jgi:hypothetical protein
MWDQFSGGDFGIDVQPTYAAFTGKGIACSHNSFIGRTLGVNLNSLDYGVYFLTPALPGAGTIQSFMTIANAGATVIAFGYNSLGQVGAYAVGGPGVGAIGTQIGALSQQNTIVPNSYVPMEVGFTPTAVTLRINGTVVLTVTGAFGAANQIFLGCGGSNFSIQFDHFYVLDLTGAAPFNTFLGNWRIQTDAPIADSATGGLNAWGFTTPQGTDWQNAANIPPNPAQNNLSATVGARMSFRFPALNTTRVFGLNCWLSAEEDSAGTRTIAPIYRSNSVDQPGAVIALPSSFTYFNQNSVVDPNTASQWFSGSVAAAGSCEIGAEVNS